MGPSPGGLSRLRSPLVWLWVSAAIAVIRGLLGLGSGGGIAGVVASTPDAPNGPDGGPGLFGWMGSMFSGGGGGPDGDDGGDEDDWDDGGGEGDWDDEAIEKLADDTMWHLLKSPLRAPVAFGVDLIQLGPELGQTLNDVGKRNRRQKEALDLARNRGNRE